MAEEEYLAYREGRSFSPWMFLVLFFIASLLFAFLLLGILSLFPEKDRVQGLFDTLGMEQGVLKGTTGKVIDVDICQGKQLPLAVFLLGIVCLFIMLLRREEFEQATHEFFHQLEFRFESFL